MESSQVFGGAEECHSSESGWTMYIGSPIHAGDDDGDGDGEPSDDGNNAYDANGHGKNCNHEEDRDDDSMASDASSGPSHQGVADFNHEEEKEDGKHGLERKDKKPVVERQKADRMRRKDDMAEEVLLLAKRGNPPAQSSSKVRKSIWRGKRK